MCFRVSGVAARGLQTWEWITFSSVIHENTIREPGLRPGQRRQQRNLATLRVLLARDYHALLMGEGAAWRQAAARTDSRTPTAPLAWLSRNTWRVPPSRYHHMSNGVQSWSQRDARLWELLLRLAVRVTWVALQRRYLNLVDAEVGRLFRGDAFNLAARRQQSQAQAGSGRR